jgi:hypothetical protein
MDQFASTSRAESMHFTDLLKRDDDLFRNEVQLAQAQHGVLVPGSDPTPANNCGETSKQDVLVFIGDASVADVVVVNSFPNVVLAQSTLLGSQDDGFAIGGVGVNPNTLLPILSLDRDSAGHLVAMLTIRSADQRVIAKLDRHGFVINRNNYLDLETTPSSLSVTDEFGGEVLNVKYLNPNSIVVSGSGFVLPRMKMSCFKESGPVIVSRTTQQR